MKTTDLKIGQTYKELSSSYMMLTFLGTREDKRTGKVWDFEKSRKYETEKIGRVSLTGRQLYIVGITDKMPV